MIKILDVTLRDGARAVNYKLGSSVMKDIASKLTQAHVEIIELGCLREVDADSDATIFDSIEHAEEIIPEYGSSEYSLLVDFPRPPQWNLQRLKDYSGGRLKHIRITCKKGISKEMLEYAQAIRDRGYSVHINPINFPSYSKEDRLRLLDAINDFHPFTFSIVDSWGIMDYESFSSIYEDVHHHLAADIHLGLHLHDNILSSFVLAQIFIRNLVGKREISIDASIAGLGKTSGNPPTEILMEFMRLRHGSEYELNHVLDAEEKDIIPLLREESAYMRTLYFSIAALHKLSPSYAKYALTSGMNLEQFYLFALDPPDLRSICQDYSEL